jgi:hypothetical protein
MNMPVHAAHRTAMLAALGLLLALPAMAQQTPLTGRMMDGRDAAPAATPALAAPPATTNLPAPPPQAPANAPVAAPQSTDLSPPPAPAAGDDDNAIGSTTRSLLRMQASGSQAGNRLPMLGDEASASYRRYIQSFGHPIPEFFETTVGKNGSNGR